MSSRVLGLFKIFRKKGVNFAKLSNANKVAHLSEKAVGLLDHMKKAHDDLAVINVQLASVITDEESQMLAETESYERKMAERERNIEKANTEIGMNIGVQKELSKFVR